VDVFPAFALEEFDLVLFPDSGLFGDFPDSGLFGDFPDAGLFGDPLSDPLLVGDGECLLGELDFDLGDPCLLPGKLLVGLCNRPRNTIRIKSEIKNVLLLKFCDALMMAINS
jgi:hypothetical protein